MSNNPEFDALTAQLGLQETPDGQYLPADPQADPSAQAAPPARDAAPVQSPPSQTPAEKPTPEHTFSTDSTPGALLRGAADTVSFGLSDEVGGFFQALGLSSDARPSVWNSKGSFSDILAQNIARNRAEMRHLSDEHTKSYVGGQIAGAVAIPAGASARGALQVAKVGAVQGGLYGLGSGEGVEGRLAEGAKDAALGAAVGAVAGKVAEKIGEGVRRLFPKAADAGEEGLTGTVTYEGPNPANRVEGWTEPNLQGDRTPVVREAGDGGAAPQEMVPLGGEDGAEAVGSISRAGLQDLQTQVDEFRARVARGGEREVDVPAEAPQGAFRLGNLGDGPDTLALLGALARQLPQKIGRTDAELMASAQRASDEMGAGDPEAVFALAQEVAGKLGDADTAIATLRTVQRRAASDVDAFHGAGVDWTTASDELVQGAGKAIYNLQRLNSLVQSARTGVGRALRVHKLPDSDAYLAALERGERLDPPAERTIPPVPTTREELNDFFELWGMTKGDPEQQGALLEGSLTVPTAGRYLAQSFANFFTASILSAPKTVILNLVGPAMVNTVRALEKTGGGAYGAINPFSTAAERAAAAEVAKQTPLALFRTLGDIRDVFRYGVQAFKENRPVLGGGGSIREANVTFGPYNDNLLRAAGVEPTFAQSTGYALGNAINIWPKAFARVNAGLDELAKRFTYLNEVRVRAQVEAATRGLEGDEAHAYVAQALKGSVDEAGAATDEGLLQAAERSTLTYQPGGAPGTLPRGAADYVQRLRSDYPLTRFVLPVFNVPANAIGETLRRVPGYNRMPWLVEHAADLAGDNGPVSQAEAHGRTLLGGSFLLAGYLLNQAGMLTGKGPDPATQASDARIWRQSYEPYSIRIGDTWASYQKLDVIGGLLAIPVTLSDMTVYHRADDQTMEHAILAGVGSLATWLKDAGAMRQATELLTLGDNPLRDPAKALERMGDNIAAGMVPASGLLRGAGVDPTDPYVRMKQGWEDYVASVLPGLSQELEPLRNVLGEPVNRPSNSLAEVVLPVTLAPVTTYAKDPVLDELTRLYQATGYGAGADPKSYGYGIFDPQQVKLEDGVSLYSHALKARSTLKLDGMTLREALRDLFDSREYNDGVDAPATARETSLGDASRGYLTRAVFDRYNKAIKADIAASSPIALKYLTAAAAKHRDDAYLGQVSLEQLVNNPDLYRANGIDPQAYSDKITDGAAGDLLDALGR